MARRWNRECPSGDGSPKTRYIMMLAIGFSLIFLAFWGMDWSFSKQASGQDVEVMGYHMSPSYWWNINWVILFIGVIFIGIGAIKIGYQKCKGEI